ncbi:solute carrier family 4 member 11-like isoform X1 [Dermacentor albipictus]|uniref:solute carrier family 4 member 11-like isoform X1 n=2 Tax=Dermacentor albipictus TaxID=60249 RepID=UPI0038FC61EF
MSVRGLRWSFGEPTSPSGSSRGDGASGGRPGAVSPLSEMERGNSECRWCYRGDRWHLENGEGGEVSLLSSNLEVVPMKDFSNEVRASMDVHRFLQDATVILDVQETTLEDVVNTVLKNVLGNGEQATTVSEAKQAIFVSEQVAMPTRTIQGVCSYGNGDFDYDQSWLCVMCSVPSLQRKRVAVARLKHPANMGRTCGDVRFLVAVLTPSKEKGTKNALETGRTFATLFADSAFRRRLWEACSAAQFADELSEHAGRLAADQRDALAPGSGSPDAARESKERKCTIARGLRDDVRRRLPYYISDYVDGIVGPRTLYKTICTTFFLYFGCLLPTIAFGALNDTNTHGKIDVKKCMVSQTIGGLGFALFSGQPLVILMTTAPLSLYIKVIYDISQDFGFDFTAMYACVGLWNSFFLFLYVIFDVSKVMKWCTRSTEEIFSLFITIAFCVDAGRDVTKDFLRHYLAPGCADTDLVTGGRLPSIAAVNNTTTIGVTDALLVTSHCQRDTSLLFLMLALGTCMLGVTLYNFNKTPYLQAYLRNLLSDYALPLAVVAFSFVGSFVFKDVETEQFRITEGYHFERARVESLPVSGVFGAMGLGFALSLLFFMDQNISAAMVNNPSNRLRKGSAYHLDLLVVGLLNAGLSVFGLPWMHGVLPHSPLHARCLADLEERVDQGHVCEVVVRSRETRLTGILSHLLIGLSLLLLPYPLSYIPTAVLDGLFLYMAVTSLIGNQMFERFMLLFTEQAAYPPNHYIRRCPQRKIHLFTFCQLVQLAVLCFFGFAPWPYVQMVFPIIILLLLPLRQKIITLFLDRRYLAALDGKHL